MRARAAVLSSYSTFEEAVAEANRLTHIFRTKFRIHDYPPYRVRKRRHHHPGNWAYAQWNGGPHDRWYVITPVGEIPDRKGS